MCLDKNIQFICFFFFSGAILAVLTVLSFVVGPFILKNVHRAHTLHIVFGIPTLLMSGICVCYGLLKPEFTDWAGLDLVRILIGFVMFYCILIAVTTIMKCLKRI